MNQGAVHEIGHLQMLLRHLTSNLTFQEAYDMTGRILSVTVCSPRKHEPPRCLNYLTSPNVVIWSAVTASCAFPGLFEAQELMAKDRFGSLVPFHPPFLVGPEDAPGFSARRWRDGSLESDLPMMQLKELFNVNHFIVSQANPHIAPLLRLKECIRAYGGNFAAKLAHLAEMEVKHRCNQMLELGFRLGGLVKLFAQDWEGDVTVVMPATLAQYSKLIQNPSYLELQKAANQGRRCTWERLSAIKANCAIELALDESVALLNHMRRLKRIAERAAAASHGLAASNRLSASRRIPSWNCIARENSCGSLEEDVPADAGAAYHQKSGHTGISSHNIRTHHDGSDSESENADLHSWTISGGPLMRTSSAHKFMSFVQNLGVDPESVSYSKEDDSDCHTPHFTIVSLQEAGKEPYYNSSAVAIPGRNSLNTEADNLDSSSRASMAASTSLLVSEGDLLQTERIENGFLFNIVKKEGLTLVKRISERNNESDNRLEAEETAECMQIENFNASSDSEEDTDEITNSCGSDQPVCYRAAENSSSPPERCHF